ncbi:MAG: hypothetical protein WCX71_04815 [Candidatus Buchananbacteria bacterium]
MGQQAGAFHTIKSEGINSLPPNLRDFVSRYFEKDVIFGQPCLVALEINDMTQWGDAWCELGIGEDGVLDLVENLNEWVKANPETAFTYHLE